MPSHTRHHQSEGTSVPLPGSSTHNNTLASAEGTNSDGTWRIIFGSGRGEQRFQYWPRIGAAFAMAVTIPRAWIAQSQNALEATYKSLLIKVFQYPGVFDLENIKHYRISFPYDSDTGFEGHDLISWTTVYPEVEDNTGCYYSAILGSTFEPRSAYYVTVEFHTRTPGEQPVNMGKWTSRIFMFSETEMPNASNQEESLNLPIVRQPSPSV